MTLTHLKLLGCLPLWNAEEQWYVSVRIAGFMGKVQTFELLNTSQEHCIYANILSDFQSELQT